MALRDARHLWSTNYLRKRSPWEGQFGLARSQDNFSTNYVTTLWSGVGSYPLDTWYHLIAIFKSGGRNTHTYPNGIQIFSQVTTAGRQLQMPFRGLSCGRAPWGTYQSELMCNGNMPHAAAWGYAMTHQECVGLAVVGDCPELTDREVAKGLVHHSDRGIQYAAGDYRSMLTAHGLECSMSRRGDCWDNAVAESFFATPKVELIHRTVFASRTQARQAIFEYIEAFYNRRRRHSCLGYVSPVDFECRGRALTLAT